MTERDKEERDHGREGVGAERVGERRETVAERMGLGPSRFRGEGEWERKRGEIR